MGFDYEELKDSEQQEQHWATYSDLFMVFSMVFLLLYTVSSLRSGTQSYQQKIEMRQLQAQNEDLKSQLKVYEVQKSNYMQTSASDSEQKGYEELMNKLSLLQDEASSESDELRRQADENDRKKVALNKYQQMIRNVINANMLSAAAIKERDRRVEKTRKISKARLKNLKTKSKEQLAQLKQESQEALAAQKAIEKRRRKALLKERNKIAKELLATDKDLEKIRKDFAKEQAELIKEKKEKTYLVSKLERSKLQYEAEMKSIQQQKKQLQKEMLQEAKEQEAAYNKQLKAQKMKLAARKKALAKFRAKAKADRAAQQAEFNEQMAQVEKNLKATKGDLNKAKKLLNARKKLARNIKREFAKAGVDADVDQRTGDVVINFGDEYFDTGKFGLKGGMKNTLNKFVPLYAQTLFKDPKIAKKIKDVEVVGFASPTFKGKYVDPKSLDKGDRKAIDYNLDLSYKRARSIFQYMFDEDEIGKYKNQKRLLPLVKVTGRSFLADKTGRGPAGKDMTAAEFCKKYDCKKAQRVIIKFNLEE